MSSRLMDLKGNQWYSYDMTGWTELYIRHDWWTNEGNQWYSYDMTGGTELDVVTIDVLTKVTSDIVMTWREELS